MTQEAVCQNIRKVIGLYRQNCRLSTCPAEYEQINLAIYADAYASSVQWCRNEETNRTLITKACQTFEKFCNSFTAALCKRPDYQEKEDMLRLLNETKDSCKAYLASA